MKESEEKFIREKYRYQVHGLYFKASYRESTSALFFGVYTRAAESEVPRTEVNVGRKNHQNI